MTASQTNTTAVEAKAAGEWSLETERALAGRSARATAIVIAANKPDPAASPHTRLAGARAWASLGAQCQSAGDSVNAVAAARSGLEELGDDYRPPGVKDDTMLKIDAASERIADGAVADGAAVLLRMLDTRIQLYTQKHASEVR